MREKLKMAQCLDIGHRKPSLYDAIVVIGTYKISRLFSKNFEFFRIGVADIT